jgi:hemerythrin superfamily protein
MKATQLLRKQHRDAERLFALIRSGQCDVEQVIGELTRHLLAHMLAEQVVLFPELLRLNPELVREAGEEHTVVRFEIRRVANTPPEDLSFRAKLTTLEELVAHHVKEEEHELFPRLEDELKDEVNERLGGHLLELFDALIAHSRHTREPKPAVRQAAV